MNYFIPVFGIPAIIFIVVFTFIVMHHETSLRSNHASNMKVGLDRRIYAPKMENGILKAKSPSS